jgi:hypothetical protein
MEHTPVETRMGGVAREYFDSDPKVYPSPDTEKAQLPEPLNSRRQSCRRTPFSGQRLVPWDCRLR